MPGQAQRNLNQNQNQNQNQNANANTNANANQPPVSQASQQGQPGAQQGQQQMLQQQARSQPGQQSQPQSSSNNGNSMSGMTPSYNGNFAGSSPFASGNALEGPSPADSTWFSFTPLVQPNDSADTSNTSALGTLGGEGSRKRPTSEALRDLTDFQLPPPQSGS